MSPDEDDKFFGEFLDELDLTEPDPSGIPHRQVYAAECCPQEVRIKLDVLILLVEVEDYLASL